MTDSQKHASHDKKPLDFKIDIDPKLGESLQGGLDSLQKVLEVAGYFHAAAKSAVPIQFGTNP